MCGFLVNISESDPFIDIDNSIQKLLRHRGPDDFKSLNSRNFHAVFWRLSIVDKEYSQQPISSADHSVTVLFNGEIYNYKDIRKEIESKNILFKTNGDAEVILHAYKLWGNKCFDRFEGMYAIVILDQKNKKFLICRDRLGVKPLYYMEKSNSFIIASEQKALLKLSKVSAKIDKNSAISYLNYQCVPSNRTLFSGIFKVSPGYIYEFDIANNKLINTQKIVSINNNLDIETYDDYKELLKKTIYKQAELTLDTNLPICFHLSGGLDSNTLINICRNLYPKKQFTCATSLVNGENDEEWEYIKKSADLYNTNLLIESIHEDNFFENFDEVIYSLDEPVGDPGVVAQFIVNKLASKNSKIVYSGQGFDELFFGYTRDLAAYSIHKWGPLSLNNQTKHYELLPNNIKEYFDGWNDFLSPLNQNEHLSAELALFKKLCRLDALGDNCLPSNILHNLQSNAFELHCRIMEKSNNLHDYIINAETTIQLPGLLHMEDRASMRYSIESRVPFCTSSIFDLAIAGKLEWKFNDNAPKGVLRDIFSDILPEHIINRQKKVGRPIPFQKWVRNEKQNKYIKNLKEKEDLFYDIFGFNYVNHAINNESKFDRTIWGAVCLSQWIDLYSVTN